MTNASPFSVQLIGGPTALIEISGIRLITDPTFDPPRSFERDGVTVVSKLSGPARSAEQIGVVDVVLLSHDQHPDNLDESGARYLASTPRVITTAPAAQRLRSDLPAHLEGLDVWESTSIETPDGVLRVTALPAQHGPTPDAHEVNGTVVGFFLEAPDGRTVYVSGDNASVDVVREIVERVGQPDVAVLFLGGGSLPFLFDGAFVTLNADLGARAADLLGNAVVIPVHLNGWSHYTDTEDDVVQAFAGAGHDATLRLLAPGETYAA